MHLGYNTNGLAHHDILEGIELLAEIGYRSVAITLDHGWLNPFDEDLPEQIERVGSLLKRRGLRSSIETGARFLLDPRNKHEPTLVTADAAERARRIDFLERAVDIAHQLESDCVSIWSGILRDDATDAEAFGRLVSGLEGLLAYAEEKKVVVAFEPEPGMFIDTMDRFSQLLQRVDAPQLKLTLDIGHLHCQDETPLDEQIKRWAGRLVNVHIEDMRRGLHEHLMFGEGEIDFAPVMTALAKSDYRGGIHVELSRHSHMAPQAARESFAYLAKLLHQCTLPP